MDAGKSMLKIWSFAGQKSAKKSKSPTIQKQPGFPASIDET